MNLSFLKCLNILVWLLIQNICYGQMNVNLQLNRIDSLLQIEQLRKADSLLRNISENELDDPAVRLKFEYLQAFYSSTLEDNAAALKIAFNLPEKAIQNQEYRTAALSHILWH
jgi:hypothetical protein